MIRFPTSVPQAVAVPGTVRAGGTDLTERRRHGIASGPVSYTHLRAHET